MARTMWAPGILWAAGAKLHIKGVDNFDPKASYIFVSNHQSHLDTACLFRALPTQLHFIAKKELKWLPFIGWYIWATGMIFVDRQNRKKAIESMNKAGQLIKKGKSVLVFPEGTRSPTGEVAPFKKGSFMLAIQAGIPVVPIAIYGTEKAWPSGTLRLTPQDITIHVGKPIMPVETKQEVNTFIEHVHEEVTALKAKT